MKSGSSKNKHSLFHYSLVVFQKTVSFLIITPISLYLFGFGFVLAEIAMRSFLPQSWFDQIVFWLTKLPYFGSIRTSLINQLHPERGIVWFTMMLGIPLMLISIGLFLANFSILFHVITNRPFNQLRCPFCKEEV